MHWGCCQTAGRRLCFSLRIGDCRVTATLDGCTLGSFGVQSDLGRRLQEACLHTFSVLLRGAEKPLSVRRTHICQRSSIQLQSSFSGAPNCRHSMLDAWSGTHAHFVGRVSCTSYSNFRIRALSNKRGKAHPSYRPTASWTKSNASSGSKVGRRAVVRSRGWRNIQYHGFSKSESVIPSLSLLLI